MMAQLGKRDPRVKTPTQAAITKQEGDNYQAFYKGQDPIISGCWL